MGMFSAPKAPNPYQTAAAQFQYNAAGSQYQQGLNQINQKTPYGSLTYSGQNNGVPGSVTATTTLSPAEQHIYNNLTSNQIAQGTIEGNQLGQLKGELSTPFNLDDAAGQRIDALQRTRLDPMWAQNSENFEQDMANRGIHPGSQAYNMAKEQFDQSKNDAYNSMYINDQAQAAQQALAARNQPINELNALQTGSQVTAPTFQNTPQAQMAGTNLMGAVDSNYQNKMNAYSGMMGGLFGLGGTLGGAAMRYGMPSDVRLKRDISRVSTLPNGLGVYVWRWKDTGAEDYGLLAQEVQAARPDAVHDIGGVLHVDYAAAVV